MPDDVVADGVAVAAGGSATVTATLFNPLASDLRVQVWAVSPYGSWEAIGPRTQPVDVPAGGRAEVGVRIAPPLDAAPGHTWLLVKAAAVGDVRYSRAVRVVIGPAR